MSTALWLLGALCGALLASHWRMARLGQRQRLRGAVRQRDLDDALALLQALPAAVIGTDQHGAVRYLNPRAELMTGYAAGAGAGLSLAELLTVYQDGVAVDARQQILDCVGSGDVLEAARGAVLLRRGDGKRTDVQYCCAPLARSGAVMLLQDVSARRSAEAHLEFIAHHDGLTGLPNRLHFQIRFEHAIAYARRHRSLLAVLFVDLDRFKCINDSLGHDVGDQVLAQFAQRVLQCVRKVDTVARQGGDEFIILLTEMRTPQDAERVAEKIAGAVKPPFVIGEYSLSVRASIGVAIYPEDDDDVNQLIEKADMAMYVAKRQAPGSCVRYAPNMQTQSYSRAILDTELRHALERQEFVLYYQPRLDLRAQRITGVKALLRWRHPTLGLVMPPDFLPVLEERALILPVGAWVMAEAAAQARRWIDQGQPLTVSVNLSPRQFYQTDIARSFGAILDAAGVPGRYIELEIAAGILIDKNQNCETILRQFKQLGMGISISDFGTGDTSLSYLKRFPADVVKIEKCFIDDLRRHDVLADHGAMVRAIVAMAHTMKMRVIAGGVETADQLAQLVAMECDEAFGFYLSRAVSPAEIDSLIKSSTSWVGLSWEV
ncbi:putative bifunctional diguanylate cyclase/phosphodiesterase [Janthinobacterium fluminis]|uniref:EAL domain-containing protein n=1 Tax=Janthinobacterium fluminis TaxID=2987524 RepID=A0ABT5K1W8_9BURK|nr:EAL domain-containing protein [Janthinobacterium fluminis]MDC8758979.1 EAL domain-containing protein [Janthinobacterium fluminis]